MKFSFGKSVVGMFFLSISFLPPAFGQGVLGESMVDSLQADFPPYSVRSNGCDITMGSSVKVMPMTMSGDYSGVYTQPQLVSFDVLSFWEYVQEVMKSVEDEEDPDTSTGVMPLRILGHSLENYNTMWNGAVVGMQPQFVSFDVLSFWEYVQEVMKSVESNEDPDTSTGVIKMEDELLEGYVPAWSNPCADATLVAMSSAHAGIGIDFVNFMPVKIPGNLG